MSEYHRSGSKAPPHRSLETTTQTFLASCDGFCSGRSCRFEVGYGFSNEPTQYTSNIQRCWWNFRAGGTGLVRDPLPPKYRLIPEHLRWVPLRL